MNYLKEIIAFSEYNSINPMSSGQISLWYTLMALNNKCGWREWFSVPNSVLTLNSGLSVSGIRKNRIALQKKGLIDFRFNNKDATEYKINSLVMFKKEEVYSNSDSNNDSNNDSNSISNNYSNSFGNTLYKQNKTKQNKMKYYTKKNSFNNYEDSNASDYQKLEDEILDIMLKPDY